MSNQSNTIENQEFDFREKKNNWNENLFVQCNVVNFVLMLWITKWKWKYFLQTHKNPKRDWNLTTKHSCISGFIFTNICERVLKNHKNDNLFMPPMCIASFTHSTFNYRRLIKKLNDKMKWMGKICLALQRLCKKNGFWLVFVDLLIHSYKQKCNRRGLKVE